MCQKDFCRDIKIKEALQSLNQFSHADIKRTERCENWARALGTHKIKLWGATQPSPSIYHL